MLLAKYNIPRLTMTKNPVAYPFVAIMASIGVPIVGFFAFMVSVMLGFIFIILFVTSIVSSFFESLTKIGRRIGG